MTFKTYDIDFTKDQILNATINDDPYKHIWAEPIFTENVFAQILDHFPPRHMMAKSGDFSEQIDLVEDPGVERAADGKWRYDRLLPNGYRDFWHDFNKAYLPVISSSLKLKFGITELSYEAVRLCVDNKGAGLGPHIDRFDKFISAIFYLDDSPKSARTILLKKKENSSVQPTSRHYSYDDFDIVKTTPVMSNGMGSWSVYDDSWHAFDQKEDFPRRTIKYFVQKFVDTEEVRKEIRNTKKYVSDWRK